MYISIYEKKVYTVTVNNSTDIIKTINFFSFQIIEHKNNRTNTMAFAVICFQTFCHNTKYYWDLVIIISYILSEHRNSLPFENFQELVPFYSFAQPQKLGETHIFCTNIVISFTNKCIQQCFVVFCLPYFLMYNFHHLSIYVTTLIMYSMFLNIRPCKINYLVLRYCCVGNKSAAGLYLSPNKNKYNGKKGCVQFFATFNLN